MTGRATEHEHLAILAPRVLRPGYVAPMSVTTLQYALADHGRILATRDIGRDAAARIADLAADKHNLMLSFKDVLAVAPPFLHEIFRVIYGGVGPDREGRTVAVTELDDDVRETLQLVLDHYKLAIAEIVDDGRLELLTSAPHLAETLAAAQDLGEYFTAPQLAERLDQKAPNINQRLTQLLQAGAIAREPDPTASRGRRFRYRTAGHDIGSVAAPA
jgi:DNA-binding MarR family transcriptional regulator